MEDDKGGSSQDKYESDFIDDEGKEEKEQTKKLQLIKGQINDSEEEAYVTKSQNSGGEDSHDEEDPYFDEQLNLKLAQG